MQSDLALMAFTHIQCGCGAKLNTDIAKVIDNFDQIHGSAEHQESIMALKLSRTRMIIQLPHTEEK